MTAIELAKFAVAAVTIPNLKSKWQELYTLVTIYSVSGSITLNWFRLGWVDNVHIQVLLDVVFMRTIRIIDRSQTHFIITDV